MIAIPQCNRCKNSQQEFVQNIVFKFGTPRQIMTDQESNFIKNLSNGTCKLLKINKNQCSAFHPETNGGLERCCRVVAEYLLHHVQEDQSDWDAWIPFAVCVSSTVMRTSTGYTHFELVCGFKSEVPSALKETPIGNYSYYDCVTDLTGRLQTAHKLRGRNKYLTRLKAQIITTGEGNH
jgi:hypothetical protein